MAEASAAGPPGPGRAGGRRGCWIAGCLGLSALLGLIALGVLYAVDPYGRASRVLRDGLTEAAPAGVTVTGARVRFPARVTVDRVEIPADEATGLPALTLQDIAGRTTVASWLRRQPHLSLTTRVWGGTVAMDAVARDVVGPDVRRLPPFAVTGEVREVHLQDCIAWLQVDGTWRGRLQGDVAGEVDPVHLRASVLDATLQGRDLHVPELDFSDVVLPANKRATLRSHATYRDEIIEVREFTLSGTGYVVDGTVRIALRAPLEASPLHGRVELRLREAATWRRAAVDPALAGLMMQLLIQSKGKLHAELGGTIGEPEATLDEDALIHTLLGGEG